jgi:recombination protein RecA
MPGKAKTDINALLKDAKKKYDIDAGPMNRVAEKHPAISTGSIAIDFITGVGGLPLGRSVELFGPPASSKTTTALMVAANHQKEIIDKKLDEYILYMDYEQAMDPSYAKNLGLDTDHDSFIFAQPTLFEDGANFAVGLINTGKIRVVIFDSVAAMTPAALRDAEIGKVQVAPQARLMSVLMQQLNPILMETGTLAIFINHLKEKVGIGGPGGPTKTTPGGVSLKFYASMRIEYAPISQIKGEVKDPLTGLKKPETVASNVKVKVVKNKVAPPYKEAVVRVRFGKGFDDMWTAKNVLAANKKIYGTSGYFYFDKSPELVHPDMDISKEEKPYIHGESSLMKFADDHPDWRKKVVDLCRDLVASTVTAASVVEDEEDPGLADLVDTDLL